MPNLTCMKCRTRFFSPKGREPTCPNCGAGAPLRLDDPDARRAPPQIKAMAIGDAVLSGLIVMVGILLVLVGISPDAGIWQEMGLGEELDPDPDGKVFEGAGVTTWHPAILFSVGGGLITLFVLHALFLAKYMKERNWARITRVVFASIEAPVFSYFVYAMIVDGKGPLDAGENVAIMVLMAAFSFYALVALNVSSSWEWFHPDAEPDRR